MRGLVYILSMVTLLSVDALGQEGYFSNFGNALPYLNPATAGAIDDEEFRVSNAHRRQWRRLVQPARTMALSVDAPLFRNVGGRQRNSHMGVGLSMYTEKFGSGRLGLFQVDGQVMGAVRGENSLISVGLNVGYGQRTFNAMSASWDSQYTGYTYDPSLSSGESFGSGQINNYFNLGVGFSWKVRTRGGLYSLFGVSVNHVHLDNRRMIAHWRAELPVKRQGKKIALVPMFLGGYQAPHYELMAGMGMKFYLRDESHYTHFNSGEALEIGLAYRYDNASVMMVNYHTGRWMLGMAFDLTTSTLRKYVNYRGGMEVSINYRGFLGGYWDRKG